MNAVVKFFRRLFGMPTELKPVTDEQKVTRYVLTGAEFGDAVSYIYMGECVGFEDLLKAWEEAERDYAALGYRTCSVDDFVDYGGWGKELQNLRKPRDIGEEPVFHAAYYRKHFLNKVRPVIDFDRMMQDGQVQSGNYAVPSTEHLTRK